MYIRTLVGVIVFPFFVTMLDDRSQRMNPIEMDRIDQLRALLDKTPADADIMYMLAQEHGGTGEYQEAVAWYEQCLETDPTYSYAYFHKARAQLAMLRKDEARQTLRDGIEIATQEEDAHALGELEQELREQF
jgi:tetratricopeptide (TPR) repeat protein